MAFSPPWVSIEENEDGASTIFVTEDNLIDFPKFMSCVVEKKIGKEQGFFKICIVGDAASSSLENLLEFVKAYFGPLSQKKGRPEVKLQTIFKSRSTFDHVYGVRVDVRGNLKTRKQKELFLRSAYDPCTYSNQGTCCLQALGESLTKTTDHFWEIVRNNDCDNPIFYGSGIPLKQKIFNVARDFSLSKLNTILDLLLEPIPGIAYPYLYVGGPHSCFAWHIEDGAAFSINYLHYGAPCIWYFVPPTFYKQFENSARFFPLDPAQVTCSNPLGHKYILADRNYLKNYDIPVNTVIQQEKELIVIYPFTAHSGFRTGYSISEAANFSDPSWVELGILAPHCPCFTCNFKMDLSPIISQTRPDLLEMYTNNDMGALLRLFKDNEYINQLNLLPAQREFSHHHQRDQETFIEIAKEPIQVPLNDNDLQFKNSKIQNPHSQKSPNASHSGVTRSILKCPAESCDVTYTGGRGKIHRLHTHIKKKHDGDSNLLKKLDTMYPEKVTRKGLLCLICGEVKAGNAFHLKLHMIRMHSSESSSTNK